MNLMLLVGGWLILIAVILRWWFVVKRRERQKRIISQFAKKIMENSKDIPPEFAKIADEYFWDLVDDPKKSGKAGE